MINFNEMNIGNDIKMALEDMGFEKPTPIQEEVIPLILENKDVIAQAPTGTGKTCAFGIPVINNIDSSSENVQALILCPTRELVIQTENELKEVCKYNTAIRIVSIYGGQNIDRQLAGLRKKPHIIIGTTGRIMDHLRRKSLKLGSMKTLILDEVDEMLNMGFREDIDVILETVPKERQTVLFSATMPKEIVEISKLYQIEPVSVKTLHQESDIPNINQYYVNVGEAEKISALVSIMYEKKYGLALVFCNTKKRVDELSTHLNTIGLNCDALHGDLRQHNRDKTMKKFRSGETQILIATDVAARGIDVENIEAVFNFDAPHDEEYYVHRIGRTARANKIGDAYTFVSDKQMYVIKNCERYTNSTIIKANFSKDVMEQSIDKKLFDKTLKLVKRGDLTSYKSFLESELEAFKEKYDGTEMEDIAAALLLQINEMHRTQTTTLSEPPRLSMKEGRSAGKEGGRSRSKDGVRFFMNIGTRDKCDSNSISQLITSKTDISASNILDVYCLENFSFATVTDGNNDAMESLNGLKVNKRILAVEVASAKEKDGGRKPARKFSDRQSDSDFGERKPARRFADKSDSSDFGERKPFRKFSDRQSDSDFSERKPARRFSDDRQSDSDFSERKPARRFSDKPSDSGFGERRPFKRFSDNSSSSDFGERKPARRFSDGQSGSDFGDKKPFRKFSDKPAGSDFGERKPARRFSDKSDSGFGDKKPARRFSDKPSGGSKPYKKSGSSAPKGDFKSTRTGDFRNKPTNSRKERND